MAVPGELRGYWAAYQRFGKLPWKELVMPSIEVCERGYNMTRAQYDGLLYHEIAKNDTNLRYEKFSDNKKILEKDKFTILTASLVTENGSSMKTAATRQPDRSSNPPSFATPCASYRKATETSSTTEPSPSFSSKTSKKPEES